MGQYFLFTCPQRKEYIHPWDFDSGSKECEFLSDKLFLKAVAYLLTKSSGHGGGDITNYQGDDVSVKGSWWGYSTMIVGDYDDSDRYQKSFSEYTCISRNIIFEWCKIDAFLTPGEIDRLLHAYDGNENKQIRQALHIAMTYSRRFWGNEQSKEATA